VSNGTVEPTVDYNDTSANGTVGAPGSLSSAGTAGQAQSYRHKHTSQAMGKQPAQEMAGGEKSSIPYRPPRRGPPNVHQHFDINEHLPWMIVLFLLLVLVVIVVCSVRKSSRTLKKGPRQDPSAIVEKAIMKKSTTPTQNREKWIYYCNGHGEQQRPGVLAADGGAVFFSCAAADLVVLWMGHPTSGSWLLFWHAGLHSKGKTQTPSSSAVSWLLPIPVLLAYLLFQKEFIMKETSLALFNSCFYSLLEDLKRRLFLFLIDLTSPFPLLFCCSPSLSS